MMSTVVPVPAKELQAFPIIWLVVLEVVVPV
jgi:hypothetical protein